MDKLILFNNSKLKKLLIKRTGESKLGEQIKLLTRITSIYDDLKNLDVDYVIFGIPEDVGVFANHGKRGTYTAWKATIKILLNTQNNRFIKANKICVLGHLDFSDELEYLDSLEKTTKKDINQARSAVAKIDTYVTQLVHDIVKAGKKPIIIGGGHNNAYGNIKGSSLALKSPINAINFDAHADFRSEEGRHSGNGFSYALNEGLLNKYYIFGLHENYTSESIFNSMESHAAKIKFTTFESIKTKQERDFDNEMKRGLKFVSTQPFGLEIDCDAIQGMPSSAMTPSGFSANEARKFVTFFAKEKQVIYLHLCEAAPKLASKKQAQQTAKLLSYLITDFIKA